MPVIALVLGLLGCRGASGPLPDDVYVWQRAWTPAVRQAVAGAGSFDRLAVLVAELSFPGPSVVAVEPAPVLQGPVVAVVRVVAGEVAPEVVAAAALAGIARVEAAGGDVVELQIDFDAPSGALDAYRSWIVPIREASPVPVTITALPDWLGRPGLPALLDAVDGWTLQLHAWVPPVDGEPGVPLFRPSVARADVARAAALDRPFRIALPTCGYELGFDADGRFLGAVAERAVRWAPEVRTEARVPDPAEVAAFVAALIDDRPETLVGLAWFRLPTTDDRLGWRASTLEAVRDGRTPVARLHPRVITDGALAEIRVGNDGDGDGALPVLVVRGPGAVLAHDAHAGWRSETSGTDVRFVPSGGLPPGDDRAVGWVRFSRPGEVTVDVR